MSIPFTEPAGLGKVGVAAEENSPESGTLTKGDRAVHLLAGSFMGGTISRTVDNPEGITRISQRDQQWVIAPSSFVRDIHAFLAFAGCGGRDQRTIHFEEPHLKGGIVERGPDGKTRSGLYEITKESETRFAADFEWKAEGGKTESVKGNFTRLD